MKRQRGFALVAAMMVLALLSVLGAVAIQSTTLEVQISARDRDARAALYLAEAVLAEAQYYASRGWGKIRHHLPEQVEVTTAMPGGFSWDGLSGFTLYDEAGSSFPIDTVSAGSPPVITLAAGSGDPVPGRFVIVRSFDGTWNDPYLDVDDAAWTAISTDYGGWLVWNAAGNSFAVQSSTIQANLVRLELSTDPGAGPYLLSLNPWLQALASGAVSAPGDDDLATPDVWDRSFPGAGEGRVVARRIYQPGATFRDTFEVTATGVVAAGAAASERRALFRVYDAGRSNQRVGDWAVQ